MKWELSSAENFQGYSSYSLRLALFLVPPPSETGVAVPPVEREGAGGRVFVQPEQKQNL
jgi:hypothetical protein